MSLCDSSGSLQIEVSTLLLQTFVLWAVMLTLITKVGSEATCAEMGLLCFIKHY